MKKYFGVILCMVVTFAATAFVSCNGQTTGGKTNMKNAVDSLSYITGVNEARRNGLPDAAFAQLGIQGFEDDFMKGFSEGIKIKGDDSKSKARIIGLQFGFGMATQMLPQFNSFVFGTDSTKSANLDMIKAGILDVVMKNEIPANLNDSTLNVLMEQIKSEAYKGVKAENEKYLEDNKAKEGVVTLPSGLQYKVIVEGTGPKPTAEDTVLAHYHGTTIDGKVFDSSVERGKPEQFPLNRVIRGWTEGLQLMPVGSKYMFYIPYSLGYGENGTGGDIGPYATLIFEVELLDIVKEEPK